MASNFPPVTPVAGLASQIVAGGTAINVVPSGPNGGQITNPLTATDQGLGFTEPLYVNPVGTALLAGNGTTFALAPGASWAIIPGQTTPTSVNALTSGHKFTVVWY